MQRISIALIGILGMAGFVVLGTGCAIRPNKDAIQSMAVETYVKGVYAYHAGNQDKAIVDLKEAIQGNPNLIMARNLLGELYRKQNDYRSAMEQYEVLTQLDPYWAENHYNLALCYHMLDRLQEAETNYQKALKLDPKNFGSNMNLGLVYLALGDIKEAVRYTEKATEINPKSAAAYANLGVTLDAQEKYDKAELAYRKSIELDANQPGTLLNYGSNLIMQGKARQAINVLQEAAKKDDSPVIHKRLGDAYVLAKQYDSAMAEYKGAIKLNPKYFVAINECARLLITQYKDGLELDDKKRDDAIGMWKKSLQMNPNQPKIEAMLKEWDKKMFSN